jgi:general secretion pathway protein A
METYRHFGLSAAPFDGRPDPRFFYGTQGFAETLATLQYAVASGKACTFVLGEPGAGKTLLGRVLVQHLGTRSDILWVRGLGQPSNKTVASVVCASGAFAPARAPATHNGTEIPLTQWLRTARAAPHRPQESGATLIVDDADGLRANAWEDILSLIADPLPKSRLAPVTAVICGLPTLLDPGRSHGPLVRLQRRLFRVCHLLPLTREETAGYVCHRIAAVGGKEELFSPPALGLVHELSEGNPALINQLCDNALVEAFGEDHASVDMPDILAAARSITGAAGRRQPPGDPDAWACRNAPGRPVVHEESLLLARLRSIAGPLTGASALPCDPLGDRLHGLQTRLTEALSRVRTAVGPASSRSIK